MRKRFGRMPAISMLLVSALGCARPSGPLRDGPRQLTGAEVVADYPAFSPDGRLLAYATSPTGDVFGGNWDLWVRELGEGAPRRLTTDASDDRFPSFSPSGDEIAFWSSRDGGGYYRVGLDGAAPKRVPSAPSFASGPPAWSPDGRELALVVRIENGVGLELVGLEANERVRLLPLAGSSTRRFDLSASPDGRFFAYVDASSLTAHVSTVFVLERETGASRAVTDGWTNDWSPFWSPDGSSLYFVSNRGGSRDVWRQPMAGAHPAGEPVPVTQGVGARHARLAPDGSRLALSKGRTVANVWRVPWLRSKPASWSEADAVSEGDAYVEFISLSPDGRWLAATSDASGNPDLWLFGLEDAERIRLTDEPTPDWGPSFSPDGTSVAFYAYRSGNRDLWVVPREGGPARQLTTHPSADMYPAWSPDGERIVFYSVRSGNRDLWMLPASGGAPRQLTRDPADDLFPVWSPDGGRIAFYSDRDGTGRIWELDPGTGDASALTSGPGRFPRYSPDGTKLLFTGWEARSGNLFEVDLETGEERQLTELSGRPGSLGSYALATDGASIYFTWERNVGVLFVEERVP